MNEPAASISRGPQWLRNLHRSLDRAARMIEVALLAVAGIAVVGMMVIITASALSRYLFSRPMAGSEVVVGVFLAPLATYLALASALTNRQHVGVTIMVQRLRPSLRRASQLLAALIVGLAFAILAYQGWIRAFHAFSTGQIDPNVGIPLYLAYAVVPIGCAGISVRAFLLAMQWWSEGSWRVSLANTEGEEVDLPEKQTATRTRPGME